MIYVAFALCCLIWGSTFLAIRIGNEAVAPVWGAALRLGHVRQQLQQPVDQIAPPEPPQPLQASR